MGIPMGPPFLYFPFLPFLPYGQFSDKNKQKKWRISKQLTHETAMWIAFIILEISLESENN
jgi:hypothetical protein